MDCVQYTVLTKLLCSSPSFIGVQEKSPFWQPVNVDVHIGSVHVYLESLTYMVGVSMGVSVGVAVGVVCSSINNTLELT